jgi:hypothetical protein
LADVRDTIRLKLALFVGERNVFSRTADVCVEPKPNLVVVFAAVIVVDHPSSSTGASCPMD